MIRLPDIPGLSRTPVDAPGVRLAAAQAPAAALTDLAKSIAFTSDQAHGLAMEVQRRENARALSEIRGEIAQRFAEFDAELDRDTDPASRIDKTKQFLDAERIRYQGKDDNTLPPAVRDAALEFYTEQGNRFHIQQIGKSARLADQRARLAIGNELQAAEATGDRERYEAALDNSVQGGVLLPEEAEQQRGKFDRAMAGRQVEIAVEEDPALVLEDIERPDFLERMPGLTPDDIPRIRRAAEASSERHRSDQLDIITEALTLGKLTPADLEAADYLRPSDIARVKRALDRGQQPEPLTAEEHGKAWDTLLSLREAFTDPGISDSAYAARYNDTRAEVLAVIANTPEAFRTDITSELSRRSPANRSAEKFAPTLETDPDELRAVATDRITRARAAGMFGPVAEDAPPAEREKAYRRAEELRLKVSAWLRANPEADIEATTNFTDGLISGDRVKDAARSLQSFIPGAAQSLRPAPAAPIVPALPPKQGAKDKAAADPLQIPPGTGGISDALLPARQKLDALLSDQ